MDIQFANNAVTSLGHPIGQTDTVFNVVNAAIFPQISGTQYFYATIYNSDNTQYEIIKVTGLSGNVLTVTRGVDGTVPGIWAQGTPIELRVTRCALQDIQRISPVLVGIIAPPDLGHVAYSTGNFQPGMIQFFTSSSNNDINYTSTGTVLNVGGLPGSTIVQSNSTDSSGSRSRVSYDGSMIRIFDSSGTVLYEAKFVSFDSNGFTINFTVVPPGGGGFFTMMTCYPQ